MVARREEDFLLSAFESFRKQLLAFKIAICVISTNQRQAQRQAQVQNGARRRPAIVLLNEKPSNFIL